VVITGLGVATPIGLGIDRYWDALLEGRCGLARIRAFDPSGFAVQIGGELPEFQLGDFIPKSYRKSAKVMARDIQIAVACAYLAVKDAGLITRCLIERGESPGPASVDSTRLGANIGAGLICADLAELAGALNTCFEPDGTFSFAKWGSEGMTNLTPLWLLKFLPNMLACHVTIVHDTQAVSNTITCGEASSHLAIGEAFRAIARGDADVCLCGGAESKLNPMALTRPALWQRLNTEANDHPERACCPFSPRAAGMVVAEGGGLLVLESLDHARARKARIYAEIVGFGAASNAWSWSQPDAEGRPVAGALRAALRDAQTTADRVDLVNPFGTAIPAYDAAEAAGWQAVLGSRPAQTPAAATKGALGVNGAGSGAIDVATTVMALHRNTVPPSLNTEPEAGKAPFRFSPGKPLDAPLRQAASVGYALSGGQVGAIVVRKLEE